MNKMRFNPVRNLIATAGLAAVTTLAGCGGGGGGGGTSAAPLASTPLVTAVSTPVPARTASLVVDTHQSKTYNASAEIAPPAIGAAFYGQDAQHSRNAPSRTLSTDGLTVRDNVTGLTWMRGPNTTLAAPTAADKMTQTDAQAWVGTLNQAAYGGFTDWRLPTIKELYSLIRFNGTDPSGMVGTDTSGLTPFIDTLYFNFAYGQTNAGERVIDAQYLTRSTYVVNPGWSGATMLFGVNFADGRIKGYDLLMPGGATKTFFVQLVRGSTGYAENQLRDNGDGSVTDSATGLMWSRADNGAGVSWLDALAWVQTQNGDHYLGHDDWRLPNAKELQSIVDYANAPDFNGLPAIDTTFFTCSSITNENGQADFPYFWTSTTHQASNGGGGNAVYISFGRALGWPTGFTAWVDVHGAGCQRSDPKVGPPFTGATTHTVTVGANTYTGYALGPQGDALRALNYVRLVRDAR